MPVSDVHREPDPPMKHLDWKACSVPHLSGGPDLSNNTAFVKLLERECLSANAATAHSFSTEYQKLC